MDVTGWRMDKRLCRVLILDTDPDTLITLQHLLEGAHIDSTITWDEAEARQLLGSIAVDLMLIYDHPPEVNAAAILRDLSSRESILPVLILRGVAGENDHDQFRRLGAMGVVPRHDFVAVLERVKQTLLSAGCENNCVKASAEGVSAQAT